MQILVWLSPRHHDWQAVHLVEESSSMAQESHFTRGLLRWYCQRMHHAWLYLSLGPSLRCPLLIFFLESSSLRSQLCSGYSNRQRRSLHPCGLCFSRNPVTKAKQDPMKNALFAFRFLYWPVLWLWRSHSCQAWHHSLVCAHSSGIVRLFLEDCADFGSAVIQLQAVQPPSFSADRRKLHLLDVLLTLNQRRALSPDCRYYRYSSQATYFYLYLNS